MDVKVATMEEMQAEYLRLAQVVVAAQNERKAIQAEMGSRVAAARSRDRIRAMDPMEREALAWALAEEKKK